MKKAVRYTLTIIGTIILAFVVGYAIFTFVVA